MVERVCVLDEEVSWRMGDKDRMIVSIKEE